MGLFGWRLPRISNRVLVPFFATSISSSVLYYETKRFIWLKNFKKDSKKHLELATGYPYYGKSWGMMTDYGIETSLKTGDLVFMSVRKESLGFVERIRSAIMSFYSADVPYDDIGIVYWKDGLCYVVSMDTDDSFKLNRFLGIKTVSKELYSKKLARLQPHLFSIRRLQCNSIVREQLKSVIEYYLSESKKVSFTFIKEVRAQRLRAKQLARAIQAYDDQYSVTDATTRLLSSNTSELTDLKGQTHFGIMHSVGDEISRQWNIATHQQIIFSLIDVLYYSELLVEKSEATYQVLQETVKRALDLLEENTLSLIEKLETSDVISSTTKSSSCTTSRIFGYDFSSRLKLTSSRKMSEREKLTSAGLVVAIYQKTGLLPDFPDATSWCIVDLLLLREICSISFIGNRLRTVQEPTVEFLISSELLPWLSTLFHIRDDTVERQRSIAVNIFRKRPTTLS